MSTEQNVLVARIEEMFSKLENRFNESNSEIVKKTIEKEAARLDEQQNMRQKLDKLEGRINETDVALAETDGKISNLKTGMDGEIKLIYEKLSGLEAKIDKIVENTSKKETTRSRLRIAVIAAVIAAIIGAIIGALPQLISVL